MSSLSKIAADGSRRRDASYNQGKTPGYAGGLKEFDISGIRWGWHGASGKSHAVLRKSGSQIFRSTVVDIWGLPRSRSQSWTIAIRPL
jgi:hypothetical protein